MKSDPVIFYGAGVHALMIFKRCSEEVAPRNVVAFCDRDTDKYNKKLFGLPIMSLEDAKSIYGEFDIYVTAMEYSTPEIIAFLLERGVPESRIINYEPIERVRGCVELETSIVLNPNPDGSARVRFCCMDDHVGKSPSYIINNVSDLKGFFDQRDKLIEDMSSSALLGSCSGCPNIKEHWRFKGLALSRIRYGGPFTCNCYCKYCQIIKASDPRLSHDFIIDIADNLRDYTDSKHPGFHIFPGEIAIHPQCRALLQKVKGYDMTVGTNATVYSESLAEVLSQGRCVINVSLDSGTRETFHKVKGIDAFNSVLENLDRYSKCGLIILKYVFMQGINDTDSDIEGFFDIACKYADYVVYSRDCCEENDYSDKALGSVARWISDFTQSELMVSPGQTFRSSELVKLRNLTCDSGP